MKIRHSAVEVHQQPQHPNCLESFQSLIGDENCRPKLSLIRQHKIVAILKLDTPGKKTLFRNGDARANGRRHENHYVKFSSQLRGECCTSSS